jgi:subtilisin-like proprotein convertase family protein
MKQFTKLRSLLSGGLLSAFLCFTLMVGAQTVLLDPAGDGGFENGTTFADNGWTLSNSANNPWVLGTAYSANAPFSNRTAYPSIDGGASSSYVTTSPCTNYFYRDISVPAGEEIILLSLNWYQMGESTGWDIWQVFVAPTSITPVGVESHPGFGANNVPAGIAGATFAGGGFILSLPINPVTGTYQLPASLAGTTFRLIFLWKSDTSAGTMPGAILDNIGVTSQAAVPVCGIKTIDNTLPTGGGNYNSFTDAINDLNFNGICGSVTYNVTAGQTFNETPPFINTTGSSTEPIIFQKSGAGSNPIVIGTGTTAANESVITLSGVDYITFDGIDIGVSNNLMQYGYRIRNSLATVSSNNNTIQNCTITLDRSLTSSAGVIVTSSTTGGGITPSAATGSNSNNVIDNVTVINAYFGINVISGSTAWPGQNNVVSNCTIGAPYVGIPSGDIGGGTLTNFGIQFSAQNNGVISGNTVQNITTSGLCRGIYTLTAGGTTEVSGNVVRGIRNISPTGVSAHRGIELATATTAGTVMRCFNNMISDITAAHSTTATATRVVTGIYLTTGSANVTYEVDFNSVNINSGSLTCSSVCLDAFSATSVHRIRSNSLVNATGAQAGVAKHWAIRSAGATLGAAGSVSNYNNLYIANPTNGFVGLTGTTDRITIADWTANITSPAGTDANSIGVDPIYVDPALDLHATGVGLNGAAIPGGVAHVTVDIDGETRLDPSSIGADEYIPATCFAPDNVVASNVTATSVDISWDLNGADSYNWEIRINGAAGSGPAGLVDSGNTTGNTASSSILPDQSILAVYVQAVCAGPILSNWSPAIAFTTPCIPNTAPWFEDFDGLFVTTNATWPSTTCFTATPENTSALYRWDRSTGTTPSTFSTGPLGPHSGSTYAYVEASSGLAGAIATLDMPLIDLSALSDPALSFYYHMWTSSVTAGAMGTLNVQVSTDGVNYTTEFTVSGTQQAAKADPYIETIISLAAYSGQIVYIRFQGVRGSTFDGDIAIDAISVDEAPTCLAPINLTVDGLSSTSVDLSWSCAGCTGVFYLEYGPPGFTPGLDQNADGGTVVGPIAGTSTTISGLTANTNYSIYVRQDCDVDGFSNNSSPASVFTGACISGGPSSISDTNVGVVTMDGLGGTGFSFDHCAPPGGPDQGYLGVLNQTALVAAVAEGLPQNLTVQWAACDNSTFGASGSVWIDWNNNLLFEPSEVIATTSVNPSTSNVAVEPPPGTSLGPKTMRVMMQEGGVLPLNPCGSFTWGSVTDFTVEVVSPPSCSVPGASAIILPNCGSSQFSIQVTITDAGDSAGGLVNVTNTGGYPTQFDLAVNDVVVLGPFPAGTPVTVTVVNTTDNICNFNAGTFNTPCVFCGGGPSSLVDSNVQQISVSGFAGSGFSHTGCSPAVSGVQNLQSLSVDIPNGFNYNMDVQYGTCSASFFGGMGAVWVDWNGDFVFSPSELVSHVALVTPGPWNAIVNLSPPPGTPVGPKVMRVMQHEGGPQPPNTPNPCAAFTWGSVMDFTVNVIADPGCTPPLATITVVSDCPNDQFSLSVNVTSTGDSPGGLIDITNNGGQPALTGVGTGVHVIGPFTVGTPVNVQLVHLGNALCTSNYNNFDSDCNPVDFCNAALSASPGSAISGANITTFSTINVGPQPGGSFITDLDVVVQINHTTVGNLNVALISPCGTSVTLQNAQCGFVSNMQARYNDEATDNFAAWCSTRLGSVIPQNALSAFDDEPIEGIWTLAVTSIAASGSGTLVQWCLLPTLTTCVDPVLATSDITNTSITVDVASLGGCIPPGTYSTFDIAWEDTPGCGAPCGSATGVTFPYTITGLNPSTFYDITVVASCTAGGTSNLVGTGVSTTACDPVDICAYTLTLNRTSGTGFGGALVEVNNGWSVTSYTLGSNESNNTFNILACPGVQLSVSLNNGGQGGLNSTYQILLTNAGNVNVLNVTGPSEGQLVVLPDPCPDCAAPLNVTLGQFAADYVEVSWMNGGDPTDDYLVELNDVTFGFPIPVDFAVVAGTSHVFNFFSSPFTDFDVCVTSNCSNQGVSLPSCVSFSTPSCDAADQCEYVINAFDSGANGWGDYAVDVIIDGGVQTIPYTLASGASGNLSFFICGGSTIDVVFNSSGGGGSGPGPFVGCTINTTQFSGGTIPDNGTVFQWTTCQFATEFAPITILSAGTYRFTSSIATDFLTLANGSGVIQANGSVTPLEVFIPAGGAYRVYFNTDAACGQNTTCRAAAGQKLITCSQPSFDLVLNPSTDNVTLYSAATGSFCTLTDGEVLFTGVTCPTCFDMDSETVFNVTGTSAEFSWSSSNGPGATGIVYIGAPGFDYTNPGDVLFSESVIITVTGTNFATVSGLSTLTNYEAVIIEECNAPSGDFSLPSSTLSFTTLSVCPDPANLDAIVGASSATLLFDAFYPGADYTLTLGEGVGNTWSVNVFSPTWGDCVQWQLRDVNNNILLSGGGYGNGYNITASTQIASSLQPLSFTVTSTCGDNSANYTISCNGVVESGFISGVTSATETGMNCNAGPPPPPPFLVHNDTTVVGQNELFVSGLALNTTYEFCVSYNCTALDTTQVVCYSFTTPALANGVCGDAIQVSCGSNVTGTTVGAPLYNDYVNCGAFGVAPQTGVWYYYEGDNSDVVASTCIGTPFDTRLTVYRGSCGAFECVAGNDDACGLQSSVNFTALTGYDYYIFVHGFSGTGTFTLNVSCTPLNCTPAASNPYCTEAQTVVPEAFGACTPIAGDNSCSAIATFPAPGCAPVGARIVWYSITATAVAHNLTIFWDGIVSPGLVLQGSCGVAGGCVAAVADGGFVQATGLVIGNTYYVGIFSTQANAGAFEICVTDPPPPAPNDLCAGAYPLTPGIGVCGPSQPFNSIDFTTTNSPVAAPACGAYNGLDQWYSVVMPISGEVTIRTTPGTITNTALAAYVGTCAGTLTQIGCSETGAGGNMAQLTITATPGITVRVRAWAQGGGILGTFDVCAIAQPTNDQCATPSNVNIVAETCFNQIGSVNFATANNTPTIPFSSCATNGTGRDVWYQFTAETSQMFITAQGLNGSFDMVIEAWDGCAGTLLGCVNNTGGSTPASGPQGCWLATGTPGYPSDPTCEAAICAADAFCCNTQWDGICANAALVSPSCTGCGSYANPASANGIEELALSGLTPGDTYLLRFYHNSASAPTGNGLFTFCVRHTWQAALTPAQCGVMTYTTNDALTAIYPGGPYVITGSSRHPLIHLPASFEWKFVNTTTLNEYYFLQPIPNYNCELQYPQDALGNVLEYDTEYEVSVRILVNGIWGDFSTTCLVGLQPLPATSQVRPNWTPTNPFGQAYSFCNNVSAENVNFASQYEFEFDNGIDPVITKTSPNYNVLLGSVVGLQMNTIYQVRVRVMVAGVWGPYGVALPIQIGLPANTQLLTWLCGTTRQLNQSIAATSVCGASEYVFRFQHATEPERIVVRPSYTCPLWLVLSPLTPGETYQVSVRVTQGGIQGDYSSICPITIAGPQAEGMADAMISRIAGDDITATIFPNPNNGSEVSINLSNIADEHQMVTVEVYDIYGKRVHMEQFANTGSNLNAIVSFGQKLASGMYLMNISLNDTQVVAERLVVQ